MTRPISCINHPMKMARCMCNKCKNGLCKDCYTSTGPEGNKMYWCFNCSPPKSNRGVAEIQL